MGSLLRTVLISLGLLALLAVPAIMLVNSANKVSHESDTGGSKPASLADKDMVAPRANGKGVANEDKLGSGRSATKREAKGSSKAVTAKSYANVKGIGRRGKPPLGAAVFPDNTWLLPLNGVKFAGKFPGFTAGVPYAPVVEIFTASDGLQWFRHANGMNSNTQMLKITVPGQPDKLEAGWAVSSPAESLPVSRPDNKAKTPKSQTDKVLQKGAVK